MKKVKNERNGLLVAALKYLQVVFYRTHDYFLYLSHALKLCIEPFLKSFLISLLPFSPSWWMKDSHGFPSRSVNIHVVLSFRPKPSLPLLLLTGHLSPLERTIDVLQSQAVCHHFFIVDRRILIVLHSKIVHIWETVVLLSSGTGAALQVIHRISLNILRYFTCIKIYTFWSIWLYSALKLKAFQSGKKNTLGELPRGSYTALPRNVVLSVCGERNSIKSCSLFALNQDGCLWMQWWWSYALHICIVCL